MELVRLPDALAVANHAADLVTHAVSERPGARVLLPAGATPVPLYAELERRCARGAIDLRRARAFQLDEYVGVPSSDPLSFHAFLREHAGLARARCARLLEGSAPDPHAAIAEHAAALATAGGADLVLLGLGRNGHLAFNEPGSEPDSTARIVPLAPATRAGLSAAFAPAVAPTHGMTLGLREVLAGRHVVLLVTGASKATALEATLRGPPTAARPASWLATHPAALVLADEPACAALEAQ